jgi:(p)ppGpp synthase/HD superfamily hydrolase
VIDILFENNPNITLKQVIVAMLHDSVEDTNISIDTIKKLFGNKIALSVALLSKESPLYFENDTQSSEAMSANEILNNNSELKDHIKSLVKNA